MCFSSTMPKNPNSNFFSQSPRQSSCKLYENAVDKSKKRPFSGKTLSDTIAAIVLAVLAIAVFTSLSLGAKFVCMATALGTGIYLTKNAFSSLPTYFRTNASSQKSRESKADVPREQLPLEILSHDSLQSSSPSLSDESSFRVFPVGPEESKPLHKALNSTDSLSRKTAAFLPNHSKLEYMLVKKQATSHSSLDSDEESVLGSDDGLHSKYDRW